jgi:hypothetical protein
MREAKEIGVGQDCTFRKEKWRLVLWLLYDLRHNTDFMQCYTMLHYFFLMKFTVFLAPLFPPVLSRGRG